MKINRFDIENNSKDFTENQKCTTLTYRVNTAIKKYNYLRNEKY